ncbi:NAD(P)H-dependent oxidoreductase [Hazenella sp. IB182353]|uniref:NAD(P)H-dependent oxidoreductase n=1 Tax=Polycladospora coralii TaxID=2771432 RepID=UPI0017464327|nr:NAD(P)H-dependent oxidoreductase [Polycladospora coralii]MBS7531146.1 NAD(P)H-dependent oxidoreductase [Polycladospora coralii]
MRMTKEEKKQQIIEAFHFRHASKAFEPTKIIPKEDFDFILETGRLSPSSFGFEPWKLFVIQNPVLREKLKPVVWGGQGTIPTASHLVLILSRTVEDMHYDAPYIQYMNHEVHQFPHEVEQLRYQAYKKFQEHDFHLLESERAVFDWASKQTYIALGNMMTAAAQIGIDSCPMEGFDKVATEEILREEGILTGNRYGLATIVAFGYRVKEPRPKTRQSIEQIVDWVE